MLFRLTIHGQPFCDWTGCIAHRDRAADARVTDCTYRSRDAADQAAKRLADAGLTGVEAHDGDCPNND